MGAWFILRILYLLFYFLSSPFLFVYGDDRVIRYTGADVDTGGAEDVQATEWGLALGLELGFFSHVFYYVFIYEHGFWELVTLYCLCYKFWHVFFINLNFPAFGVLLMRLLI